MSEIDHEAARRALEGVRRHWAKLADEEKAILKERTKDLPITQEAIHILETEMNN